ncbi:MAG: DUF5127 domain-containing protein, partial [Chitinophagales bacterium]
MKKLFFFSSLYFISLFVAAQSARMPAYPLITHDPYFSIWSFSDNLNESTTKHWTGKDHSLLGIISVDGKIYKFLGAPERKYKAIVPWAEDSAYSCQYTVTKPAGNWTSLHYDASKWQTGKGLFGTKEADPKTLWTSREIWIRRTFDWQAAPVNEMLLRTKYDDNVEIYLNGEKIYIAGCCSGNKEVELTKSIQQKLKKGKNVLAMYCENTGGQAYIDAGLYDRLPPLAVQQAIQKKVEITATQTKYEFSCGPVILTVDFLSPLLMDDIDLYSRPISFVTFNVKSTDDQRHYVKLFFDASPGIAKNKSSQLAEVSYYPKYDVAFQKAGTKDQPILKRKGDDVRIDWGYSY